jgi:membrane associated rhomboid family serine protease
MIIPLDHENSTVRRLPWITFAIVAICLIVHIIVSIDLNRREKELEITVREFLEYYVQHPYLELDPEILTLIFGERLAEQAKEQIEILREEASREVHLFQEQRQQELNQLSQKLKTVIVNIPYRKYGFIPAKRSFLALLTYMFIHSGWFHLLGNLLFLYLTGPFIEDVWGRPIYIAFYLIMGVSSALMFAQHYPDFAGPLIGASGAVAGVMGAFLILYWKTKIRFFFILIPLFFIRGTFKAPAWLMLPLWFLLEFFNAKVMDAINPQGGGGVAHWAHVWGFVFGVVAAFGMKYFKIEEKYVRPKIDAQTSYVDEGFQALEDATEKKNVGKSDEAYAILLEAAKKNPKHKELIEGLWELGIEMGKEKELAKSLIALVESEIRRDQMEIAASHFWRLRERIPQASISPTYKIKLVQYLKDRMELEDSRALASELLEEVNRDSPPLLLLNFSNIAPELNPSLAVKVIELCIQHPEIQEHQKNELRKTLGELQGKVQDTTPAADRSLKVTQATPVSMKEGKLSLSVEGVGERGLTLDRIQSIAVAEIISLEDIPYLLIDIFLDNPKSSASAVRSIRLMSSGFDPRKFFPDIQDVREALRSFISNLLESSGATPYPDKESVLLNPPRSFHSMEEYEESILS